MAVVPTPLVQRTVVPTRVTSWVQSTVVPASAALLLQSREAEVEALNLQLVSHTSGDLETKA